MGESVPAEAAPVREDSKKNLVSLIPLGLNEQHPRAYREILGAAWENRDQLGYAWRILKDGCCDGCSLGTSGLHDWTMKGILGPRLLVDRFLTPDGKGHFSAVELPEERVPAGHFLLSTRRGKQFNSIIHGIRDSITGAARDDILMAQEDASRLGLNSGDGITLRNDRGEFRGRVKIDRIKPGCLQGYWPELNVLVPAGCLDPSGVPDYNAIVEVIPFGRAAELPAAEVAKA